MRSASSTEYHREQYSVDNRVVPPDAVVLGDLSHQLVCRRVVPAAEQRFQFEFGRDRRAFIL
jgi:hypothetical protein